MVVFGIGIVLDFIIGYNECVFERMVEYIGLIREL